MSVEEIFTRAIDIPSPEKRNQFLDNVFSRYPEYRDEVESLIRSHEQAGSFLNDPIVSPRDPP